MKPAHGLTALLKAHLGDTAELHWDESRGEGHIDDEQVNAPQCDQENTPNSPGHGTPLLYNSEIFKSVHTKQGRQGFIQAGSSARCRAHGIPPISKKMKIVEPSTLNLRSALRRLHDVLELVEGL